MKKVIVFDLETTGFNYKEDKIIEFGAVELIKENNEPLKIINEYNFLVNPLMEITNSDIHHITNEMVEKNGVLEIDLYNKIKHLFNKENILVAYNAHFDLNFIYQLFLKFDNNYYLDNDLLDVMAIYKDRYEYPHKLSDAIEKFNIDLENTHRALDDVKATYEVLKCLGNENNNIFSYINKFGYNEKYPINGEKFKQITYIPQKGKRREIEQTF